MESHLTAILETFVNGNITDAKEAISKLNSLDLVDLAIGVSEERAERLIGGFASSTYTHLLNVIRECVDILDNQV